MTDSADPKWRLITEERRSGPMNMALDEIAGETAAAGGPRTLRVYSWEPSTFSLGYGQESSTVDWEFCEREGITVTRRPTGGGGIYHDAHGDISYSIAAPAADLPGDLMKTYEMLCAPVFDAFERLGVSVNFAEESRPARYEPACYLRALHPAHDIVADGRKVSGNAQHRWRDSVIQHGSIQFSCVPDTHIRVFDAPDLDTGAFEERVTSIEEQSGGAVSRAWAVAAFEDALREWADDPGGGLEAGSWVAGEWTEGKWTENELARARERADEKYASPDWNRRRDAPTQ